MILVDANQIAISHLMVRQKIEDGINIDSIRHSIVRVLARIQKQFGSEYGKMVLCYDDKSYWRTQVFPFYKKNRKQERETSKYDWDMVFSVLNKIRDEIRRNLPYYVIQVQGAEADDVIAALSRYNHNKENILILSASMKPEDFTNYIRLRNWKRNSELIDFAKIPRPIVDNIIMTYNKYRVNTSIDIQYFIDNNIQDLIEEFS